MKPRARTGWRSKPPKSKKAPATDHGAPGEIRPVEEMLTETLKRSEALIARSKEMLERSQAVIDQLEDDLRAARDAADEAANLAADLLAELERVVEVRTLPLGFRLVLEEAVIRASRLPSW